jgi:exosortase A-associated hydrolase 1
MACDMRRLLSFPCEGALLGATLDDAAGTTGVLLVTGGSQTRIGSHRMYERLAKGLSEKSIPCFRFDRRGVGDSSGDDPGFRSSRPDLAAAAAAFRAEAPALTRLYGFGLCDGASAIALFGDAAGLDGLILVNPWLVEAEAGAPPAAAVRAHYRQRLTSWAGWKKLLTGAIDFGKFWRGLARILRGSDPTLAQDIAAALRRHRLPVQLILAKGDATAIAAEAEMKSKYFSDLKTDIQTLDTDSHTFARPGDEAALLAAVEHALSSLSAKPSP